MGRTTKKQWVKFLIIIGIFLLFLFGLYLRLISIRTEAAKTLSGNITKPVRVINPIPTETWLYREVLGRVEGGQEIDIRADVGGWVEEIYFKRDESVTKDQVLIKLNDVRKVVALQEAKFRLQASKANLNETNRKYNQNKTLFEKGIISRDNLDSNKNQLAIESANMKSLEAAYNRVKWDFDNLEVRSPINGTIIEIQPDVGQEVFVGESLATVVNLENKKVIAGLDASIARLIKTGSEVDLTLSTHGITEMGRGEIVGISRNSIDDSGVYEIEVKLTGDDLNWWPGEIVTVKLPIKKLVNMVNVPRTAVFSDSSEVFIFVAINNKSIKVPVEVTWLDDKTGFVPFALLPADSQIITEGSSGLTTGQDIRIISD